MPDDYWKRERDAQRGRQERAKQAAGNNLEVYDGGQFASGTVHFVVPKGVTAFLHAANNSYSAYVTTELVQFRSPLHADNTYYWFRLPDARVIAVEKAKVTLIVRGEMT
jgi:hypothetical protein